MIITVSQLTKEYVCLLRSYLGITQESLRIYLGFTQDSLRFTQESLRYHLGITQDYLWLTQNVLILLRLYLDFTYPTYDFLRIYLACTSSSSGNRGTIMTHYDIFNILYPLWHYYDTIIAIITFTKVGLLLHIMTKSWKTLLFHL